MNCAECRRSFADRAAAAEVMRHVAECAACEELLYAAYGDSIRVPPMWQAVERRIRIPRRRRWLPMALAAAAALAVVVALQWLPRRPQPPQRPYAVAAARYREAIERAGAAAPAARSDVALLTAAIRESERSAAASDDPIAVARMVSAYDAKLQLLRSSHEQ